MNTHSLKLWRTFQEGGNNIKRNGWLAFATVSILSLSLFIVSLSALLGLTTNLLLENLREKISVNVSFNTDVSEDRIKEIQGELAQYTQEIKSVEYISRDQALAEFLEQNNNDPVIKKAIEEIGENPLLASLVIKAHKADDYPLIVEQIKQSNFQNDVARVNYEKNKKIFERLEKINIGTKKIGLALGILFVLIAILITFNTIRITIYSHRKEFEIMRLVGASNTYVRMPVIFEGALYGIMATAFTLFFLFLVAFYMAPLTEGAINEGNVLTLYGRHFFSIAGSILVLGVLLGVGSSALAIRRYLKF
jgi:cell division transport system permease protein